MVSILFIELGYDKPILSPKEFIDETTYPEKGVMIFTEYMADAVKDLAKLKNTLKHSNKPYKIRYLDHDITLIYPFYGAPATIVALEIAVAYGLKKVIVVGEAGAIHPEVRITDYIMPIWGVRGEGTSYHYMSREYTPRIYNELHKTLLNNLREKGYNVHIGGVWTIDAIFRETLDKVRRYRDMGVLCVDMESTALMTVADYRDIELAILLIASDELYHGRWVSGWGSEELKEAEYNALKTTLETLIKY